MEINWEEIDLSIFDPITRMSLKTSKTNIENDIATIKIGNRKIEDKKNEILLLLKKYYPTLKDIQLDFIEIMVDTKYSPNIKKNIVYCDPLHLKPEYTFSNYFIDQTNELAFSVSYDIATNNQKIKIPILFLTGDSGVGKSHLAIAILKEFENRSEGKYGYFFTKNDFYVMLKNSFQNKTADNIIDKIINAEYVVFDDFGLFLNLPPIYIKLIYDILDYRYRINKYTIFNSVMLPDNIVLLSNLNSEVDSSYFDFDSKLGKYKLSSSFISRLNSGLYKIDKPSYKLKFSFIKKNLQSLGIDEVLFTDNVLDKLGYLVSLIQSDFRVVSLYSYNIVKNFEIYKNLEYAILDEIYKIEKQPILDNDDQSNLRIKYLTNKLINIIEYDVTKSFEKKRISGKREVYLVSLFLFVLNKICGIKVVEISKHFKVSMPYICNKVKQFENIDDEYIKSLLDKIISDNTIK